MEDYAVMLMATAFPESIQQQDGHELLQLAASRLRRPDVLSRLGRSDPGLQSHTIEDIIRTNSFQLDISGVPHLGIFPAVSVSHSLRLL